MSEMTPCKAFNCENQTRCKAEHVACHAFYFYVLLGKLYHPKTKFEYTQRHRMNTRIEPNVQPSTKVMKMIFRR